MTLDRNLGTDAKIGRIWQASSAALALFSTLLLGIMGPPSLVLSASLATLSLLWIRDLSSSIDYRDPETLNQVRDNAKKMSLAHIVEVHGWNSLFQYEILTPDRFYALFISHVETLPIKSLIAFNEMAARELTEAKRKGAAFSFKIPHPSRWKQKFHDQTKGLSCTAILAAYPVETLSEYKILGPKENEIFDQVRSAHALFGGERKNLEEEYSRRTKTARAILKRKEELAQVKYLPSLLKRDLADLYWDYSAQAAAEDSVSALQERTERSCAKQRECETRCKAIQESKKIRKEALYRGYLSAKSSLERRIASLEQLKAEETATSHFEFALATQPIRDEIDRRIGFEKSRLDETLAQLDREYVERLKKS